MDTISESPLIKSEDIYSKGDLIVAPYPTEDSLGDAYFRFKAQDLLPIFFHEEAEPKTLYKFLTWCMQRDSVTIGAYHKRTHTDGSTTTVLIGIGKISVPVTVGATGHQKAEVGMVFDRAYQLRSWTMPACQMMLELVFDRMTIDVLYGTIPEKNRTSLRFMKDIGFEFCGPIKHYTAWKGRKCGVYISWMDAERWKEVSPFK